MSYIRNTQNPEGLYIWGDEENVHISKGPVDLGTIPVEIFNKFLWKYHKSYHPDEFEYEGIKISAVWEDNLPKVQLSYKDVCFTMWDVTFEYLVLSHNI